MREKQHLKLDCDGIPGELKALSTARSEPEEHPAKREIDNPKKPHRTVKKQDRPFPVLFVIVYFLTASCVLHLS
ncbi:hypothetical protein SAMN05192534_101199 [Alteribacillus persepolensis]|uniref:Uncharacterized protein n=1 Tax=Alteribacillus persepolensis TaxID=568899 RepID=A0A1G7YM40_9BACI|nr:hypothetical protein SAMN05192534_101199 [Alteribacillus persepolensis]